MSLLKKFFKYLCLTAFGVALALFLVELAFRTVVRRKAADSAWSDRPKAFYMPEKARFLQDKFYTREKPTGTFRIVILGDSFSFGPHMQQDDLYSERLERWLNLQTGRSTEVINLARSGLATHHQTAILEEALSYKPDVLVLQITLNDAEDKPLTPKQRKAVFGLPILKSPLFSYWKSALYFLTRIHNTNTHRIYVNYFEGLYDNQRLYQQFENALFRIAAVCRENSVKLTALVFPLFDFPIDDQYPLRAVHNKIHGALKNAGISYLDLLRTYRGIPHERLQVIPGSDSHPNEIAHRIAAETLLAWLVHKKLIPEPYIPAHYYRTRSDLTSPQMKKPIDIIIHRAKRSDSDGKKIGKNKRSKLKEPRQRKKGEKRRS